MATREENIEKVAHLVHIMSYSEPVVRRMEKKSRWVHFFISQSLRIYAKKIALEELLHPESGDDEDKWTDEELQIVAEYLRQSERFYGNPAAMEPAKRAYLTLEHKFKVLTATSVRKALNELATQYHLLLAPKWNPDPDMSEDTHKAAVAEFDRVYQAKLAELSKSDPYLNPPYTFRRRRPANVPYPEEVAYKEGAQAYYSKLVDIVGAEEAKKYAVKEKAGKVEVPGAAALAEEIAAVSSTRRAVPEVNSKGCGPMGCFGKGGRKTRRTRKSRKVAGKRRTRARRT